MTLPTKIKEFYNPSIKKILVRINEMPHELLAPGLQAREIYSELKKYFYKENSDVTWEDVLMTKFALWIDTHLNIDNTLHGSGRAVDRSGQIEKDRLRLKTHLKPVVILDATFLALRMQWPI